MKKKTLLILLIIPFLISLLSFVSVVILNNTVAADIVDIAWNYNENEGFKISNEPYLLMAEPIIDENLLLAPGSDELVWSIKNKDGTDNIYASLINKEEKYYLKAVDEGCVVLTCSNKRGTKSKHFNAHIYENGAIVVNRRNGASNNNIDPTFYLGEFDLQYSDLGLDKAQKCMAEFEIIPTLLGGNSDVYLKAMTPNIEIENHMIKVLSHGKASVNLYTNSAPFISADYEFDIVQDGYNIYNYKDLLMATNFSSSAKNIVLQVNLDSLKNTYKQEKNQNGSICYINEKLPNKSNTELFGNFDFETQTFNFENEYVKIKSTYNTKYINQYNQVKKTEIDENIIAGIKLKGDLYGNGYSINGNDLAYPNHGKISTNSGKIEPNKEKDYFFGPLPYVTIGSLDQLPVVKAFGQDNTLIYLDGDNLVVNDVNVSNSNQVDNMYNLIYTGTVIEVNGHNDTIENSILSNGRTIIRAFSSDGLMVENSILKNAAEFLMKVGSNKINEYDLNKMVSASYKGQNYIAGFKDFYNLKYEESPYNLILNDILNQPKITNETEVEEVMKTMNELQNGLINTNGIIENGNINYADTINLKSTYFYNSGIFSLAFDSIFNGPFLYNGGPSVVKNTTELFSSLSPNAIGGTSYPVHVICDSNTKFYDWKDANSIDSSILIEENISNTIKTMFGRDIELSMEDYFPMKRLLLQECINKGYIYNKDEKQYVNSKVAWYGGGTNLSKFTYDGNEIDEDMSDQIEVNITKAVLQGKYISTAHDLILLLAKCVCMATGVNPFKFITNNLVVGQPKDFDIVPQIEDLKNNLS